MRNRAFLLLLYIISSSDVCSADGVARMTDVRRKLAALSRKPAPTIIRSPTHLRVNAPCPTIIRSPTHLKLKTAPIPTIIRSPTHLKLKPAPSPTIIRAPTHLKVKTPPGPTIVRAPTQLKLKPAPSPTIIRAPTQLKSPSKSLSEFGNYCGNTGNLCFDRRKFEKCGDNRDFAPATIPPCSKSFSIRIDAPYSVKVGEKFVLQVLVINHMKEEQLITVKLKHNDASGFSFWNKDGTIREGVDLSDKNYNIRAVSVPPRGEKIAYFPIVPSKAGMINLNVDVNSPQTSGSVQRLLRVEPDGYRVDRNVPLLIDLSKDTNFDKTVRFMWPSDVVKGSQKARFEVIGDIMGPLLANVEHLVKMPHGCGEQIMVNFVPNIVVVRYLKATNRGDLPIVDEAKKFMRVGYEQELAFRRPDNSFSVFGNNDKFGSTWLTAFVVRSFAQARDYIFIDPTILSTAIAFLNQQQQPDGSFAEHGEVYHKDVQGGASQGGPALTAYVVVALLENGVRNEKAIAYLENHLNEMSSNAYALAVTTYALYLANSPKKKDAMEALEKLKIVGKDGTIHWSTSKDTVRSDDTTQYFYQPHPVDVETTAYVLLSYMLDGDVAKGLPLVQWLTAQRNSLGGFSSTQDTVIALQALASYAERAYSGNTNMMVTVRNGGDTNTFAISSLNAIDLQSCEIPNVGSEVVINARGRGTIFAQVSYSYNRNSLRSDSPFSCSTNLKGNENRLQLDLCSWYTGSGKSNMAIAEVEALTGFRFDKKETDKLTSITGVQRVELDHDGAKVNIYFDPLGATPVCLSLFLDKVYNVVDQKPAQIILFDYYNPEEQMRSSYKIRKELSLSNFCPCWWVTRCYTCY